MFELIILAFLNLGPLIILRSILLSRIDFSISFNLPRLDLCEVHLVKIGFLQDGICLAYSVWLKLGISSRPYHDVLALVETLAYTVCF